MKAPKFVDRLYDQGSSRRAEDGKYEGENFFVVFDGFEIPHGPHFPAPEFAGLSGGELLVRSLEEAARRYDWSEASITEFISQLNTWARATALDNGFSNDAGMCPGATFAAAKVTNTTVYVGQGGDTFALWLLCDGTVWITRNGVFQHDLVMNYLLEQTKRLFAMKMFSMGLEHMSPEQLAQAQGATWDYITPILREFRRQDANRPESPRAYPVLNGSLCHDLCSWHKFNRAELDTLLLFTDALVPWKVMESMNMHEIAVRVMADYKKGGLHRLLDVARDTERRFAHLNYTNEGEATAIALEF